MAAQVVPRRARLFKLSDRAVQAVWLLFMLLALSLALPGVTAFHQQLQTVCTGPSCLNGQLSPAELPAALASTGSLSSYASIALIVYLFTYSLIFLTAVTLIWRKPAHLAAVSGAFLLAALATANLAQAAAQSTPSLRLPAQAITFVQLAAPLPFFALLPGGRFQPSWLRWLSLALVPAAFLVAFDLVAAPATYVISALIALSVAATVLVRYRQMPATSPQHEQMVWALAALASFAGAQWLGRPLQLVPLPAVALDAVPGDLSGFVPVFGLLLVVGALACLTVALLNDELFQVEVVLNRALVYALLTLFVVGAYVLVVGYLSLLFQSSGSLWFSLIATGLVAALVQSVRARVQRFVNSMLYGDRAEPSAVIANLGRRLESAFATESILPTIAETVQDSLRLPYAAIALERDGNGEVVAAAGTPSGEPVVFPLTYQGTVVGRLLVNPRRGEEKLSAADRALLAGLAQHAGAAVHGVRLTAELQEMAATLQQSRERLILAREEERRRLRRDLHDDLAPALVGLSLRAGTIGDLVDADPAQAKQVAAYLDGAIRDAVHNIRRLVYDLRPPALDDLGLLAAIRERALVYSSEQGLRVEVTAPETLPPLPAAVEVAAYRIVQEGLVNVVKHAQAQHCSIHITVGAALTIEIADDGIGLPATRAAGVGLRSIQERAAELGGVFVVSAGDGAGTRLTVHLPLSEGGRP